jgi:hypothetical protein
LATLAHKVGHPWRKHDLSARASGRQSPRDEDAFDGRIKVVVRPSQPRDRSKDPKALEQSTDAFGGFICGLHEIPGGHPHRLPVPAPARTGECRYGAPGSRSFGAVQCVRSVRGRRGVGCVWVRLLVEDDAHADPVSVMANVYEALGVVELDGRLVE